MIRFGKYAQERGAVARGDFHERRIQGLADANKGLIWYLAYRRKFKPFWCRV
jgi:hypothetical protein